MDSKIYFKGSELFIEDEKLEQEVKDVLRKTQSYIKKTKKTLERLLNNKADIHAYLQITERRSPSDKSSVMSGS